MFKKIMLSAAIVAAMGTTAVQAATSGTISFEGSIVDATCTVDTSANITQTVNLGKQDAGDFDGVGTTVGQTPFSISLTDCNTDIDGASVTFSGDATTDGTLTTDNTTVGVEITQEDGTTVIPINQASAVISKSPDNSILLNFNAAYKALAATVTSGQANAQATATVNYN